MNIGCDVMFEYLKIYDELITTLFCINDNDCYYLVKTKHNKKKTWFKGCHDI